nr:MAG TPA: hypothetical protein [Herelleviridae sp.]
MSYPALRVRVKAQFVRPFASKCLILCIPYR